MGPLYSKQTLTFGHLKLMATKKTNQNLYVLFIDFTVGNLKHRYTFLAP